MYRVRRRRTREERDPEPTIEERRHWAALRANTRARLAAIADGDAALALRLGQDRLRLMDVAP